MKLPAANNLPRPNASLQDSSAAQGAAGEPSRATERGKISDLVASAAGAVVIGSATVTFGAVFGSWVGFIPGLAVDAVLGTGGGAAAATGAAGILIGALAGAVMAVGVAFGLGRSAGEQDTGDGVETNTQHARAARSAIGSETEAPSASPPTANASAVAARLWKQTSPGSSTS